MNKFSHNLHTPAVRLAAVLLVLAVVLYAAVISPAYATGTLTPTPAAATVMPKHPKEIPPDAGTSDGILALGLIIVVVLLAGTLWPRNPLPQK